VLRRALDRGWRLVATGFAFAVFFGGGGVAALTILPLAVLFTSAPVLRERRTRYLIHRIFNIYLGMIRALRVIAVTVEDARKFENIEGQLIIANHPTLLDVILLMALVPRVQCIVKHELWESRYLGGVVRRAGYIRNDTPPEQLLLACKQAIAAGSNLLIFPEGTRTRPGAPVRFHRGFANIALLTGTPIQTVSIRCDPVFLTKGEPWYQIPTHRPHFHVALGEHLDTQKLFQYERRPLAARQLVRRLEAYYAGLL
jgi:1-acyl-sn-glycerol-3-phosphate acyltransferase